MTQEMERQNLDSRSVSGSSEGSTAKSIQLEVMGRVLGTRSDYQIGVGYRPKGKGKSSTSSSTQSTQSQFPANMPPEVMAIMGEMWAKLRDKVEGGEDIDLHDARYEGVLQYLSTSMFGQTTGTSSMPRQSPQPPPQPRPTSPNLSAGSSAMPNLSQLLGLSSLSPSVYLPDQTGGFQAATGSQMGGLPQQQQPYAQFGSFMQQQAAYYPSPPIPQQQQPSPPIPQQHQTLVRPQPRPYSSAQQIPQVLNEQVGSRGFNLEFDFFNETPHDQDANNN